MCWGKTKVPDVPATPAPTPVPTPSVEAGEVASSAAAKRQKTAALRYGALNTIRNKGGAVGVTGEGADLSNPAAQAGQKKTLGA